MNKLEMSKGSYAQLVYHYLLRNGSITSLQAIKYFGNTRLSATIYTLRHEHGIDIITRYEKSKITGKPYGRYVLVSKEE